ncbi:hypothetical protein IWQ60_009211 [Tieghemiomyces parasiticus]|uniref:MARVEL domain-containing protein n=1 Tax=Tieghemiomyces parasiticus TaxID=78921 RepID=A0A9W7ZPX7_9FUNG|nr:hypothetical protein IWQ60_009211 [Tieghemiomyces parasiticus]
MSAHHPFLHPFGMPRMAAYAAGLLLSFIAFVMWCHLVHLFHDSWYGSPSSFNFALFAGLFAVLTGLQLVLSPFIHHRVGSRATSSLVHPITETALVALATLFWFCAAVATAAYVGVPHCVFSSCRTSQAAIAFSWFSFIAFAFALGLLLRDWFVHRGNLMHVRNPDGVAPAAPAAYGVEKPVEVQPNTSVAADSGVASHHAEHSVVADHPAAVPAPHAPQDSHAVPMPETSPDTSHMTMPEPRPNYQA